jgi:hypothetical protein
MITIELRSSEGQIRVRFQLPKVVIIIVSHPWPSVIFFAHPFFAAIDTKRCQVGIEQSILPFTIQLQPFLLSTPPQCYKNDDVALQISYTRVQTSIGLPAISYLSSPPAPSEVQEKEASIQPHTRPLLSD